MTIAAVFEFPSDPVEKYHKVFEAGPAIVDQPDRIYHVCYRTETGFTRETVAPVRFVPMTGKAQQRER